MSFNNTYKDPKRKVGSQKEVPTINILKNEIIVNGYQHFNINKTTKSLIYLKKKAKFTYINNLLNELNKIHKCKSIIDFGCSSGLTSLIAINNNFDNVVGLDHDPEYINILKQIKNECKISNINERVFSFGNEINEKFDVVFCGAIIHWIFSLTANFRNFDSIIKYLLSLTNNYLIIEWIAENDGAIRGFNHIKKHSKDGDEEYNTLNFEKSILKYTKIISKKAVDCDTRVIYVLRHL
jgi:2-polyprenyl-3-methyl-5-hydroxy-6-metoxy-1,4-benzoquinol methylase